MTTKSLSVAVVTYKRNSELQGALTALVREREVGALQRILVIDACPGRSAATVVDDFSGVQYYHSNFNNLSVSRNLAVEKCETDLLAFVDSDCVVGPGWGHALVRAFEEWQQKDARVVGVGAPALPPEDNTALYRAYNRITRSWLGHGPSAQTRVPRNALEVDHLSTSNALFDVSAVRECGGFDPRYERVGEDLDLGLRLNRLGYRLMLLPAPRVTHYLPHTLGEWAQRMVRFGGVQGVPFHHSKGFYGHRRWLLPVSALCLALGGAVLGYFWWGVVTYLTVLALLSFQWRRLRFDISMFSLYLCTHIPYLAGFLMGEALWLKQAAFSPFRKCLVPFSLARNGQTDVQ